MLNRLTIKNNLIFGDLDIEFNKNLIIFSGASGSGKSVLMETILTLFGYKDSKDKMIEASTTTQIDLDKFGIESEEENIFKFIRQKSGRYFINNSQISKKNITTISREFINYLNLREFDEFKSKNLINLLDSITSQSDKEFQTILDNFQKTFKKYSSVLDELTRVSEEEKNIEELKEFVEFEINKIESIAPKMGEYEELLQQKKELSKKEKIQESIQAVKPIFDMQRDVDNALKLLEVDSNFFSESMNSLNMILEEGEDRLNDLNELDIESLLSRLEKLSELRSKFGSIEESLNYLANKKEELKKYQNISYEKDELQKRLKTLQESVEKQSLIISSSRSDALVVLNQNIQKHASLLFLDSVSFKKERVDLNEFGIDKITLELKNTKLENISSGELNRLRLAYLAVWSSYIQENGILILDEIDANLSGKESTSVAKVLKELSQNYQIFAISHQPQLSSYADEHFLIYKDDDRSYVKKLSSNERVDELARMISGDDITKEAREFALKMLNTGQTE
jgi:DNA repair protein RecN (Recombination protein N)